MSLHRAKATLIGLLEGSRANEWVVTEKLGDILKAKTASKPTRTLGFRIGDRIHVTELGIGAYLFFCGCYNMLYGENNFYIFILVQSISFFIVGIGYVGTIVPSF